MTPYAAQTRRIFAALIASTALTALPLQAETPGIEKPELTLGFIKLTDMAPLAIAKESQSVNKSETDLTDLLS